MNDWEIGDSEFDDNEDVGFDFEERDVNTFWFSTIDDVAEPEFFEPRGWVGFSIYGFDKEIEFDTHVSHITQWLKLIVFLLIAFLIIRMVDLSMI